MKFNYYPESKVLQYFRKVRHNSEDLDVFAVVMEVTKHFRQWDVGISWVLFARFGFSGVETDSASLCLPDFA